MSNSVHLTRLKGWVDKVSLYPPAEIYFQAPKKLEKEEKKVRAICEQLYRFDWEGCKVPNPVGAVREALREMRVLDRLFEYEPIAPNYDLVVKMVAAFEFYAYHVYQELESMHDKHAKLSSWYGQWKFDHEVRLYMNAELWGADILRLPHGLDGVPPYNQFVSDVNDKLEEMRK